MYNEHFGLRLSPFSATPDPQVFFNNALYQEAFATLQYGVLAKKGFVLITGEVGTGKTTLLRKLLHSLGPTVHSVFIFNTQVSFVDLLRLILDDLGLKRQSDDKLNMIEILNQYLIERLRQGHIVTLLIDEAQNLCDEALEGLRLLSNLETDTEKLLQIVLMGQPELEGKLEDQKLRQLKQRITLQCRLAPLKNEEVGAYIDFRLNAAGYRGKSPFDRASLDAIARYSKGTPRLINIICDNALLAAFARSTKVISPEMIKEVAADLRLTIPEVEKSLPSSAHLAKTERREASSWFGGETETIAADDVWISRFGADSLATAPVLQRRISSNRPGAGVIAGTLVGLVTLGGVGATLYSRQITDYVAHSIGDIESAPERSVTPPASPAPAPVQNPSGPPPPEPEVKTTAPELPSTEPVPPAPEPAETRVRPQSGPESTEPTKPNRQIKEPPRETRRDPDLERRRIEAEVNKAIENRAISGVSVSVVDGVAYLDGRVASVRQRLMAERAARSVADVKSVRNRIDVKSY